MGLDRATWALAGRLWASRVPLVANGPGKNGEPLFAPFLELATEPPPELRATLPDGATLPVTCDIVGVDPVAATRTILAEKPAKYWVLVTDGAIGVAGVRSDALILHLGSGTDQASIAFPYGTGGVVGIVGNVDVDVDAFKAGMADAPPDVVALFEGLVHASRASAPPDRPQPLVELPIPAELRRNVEILTATTVTVGGLTLRDGQLSVADQPPRALDGLTGVQIVTGTHRVALIMGAATAVVAVGCGGVGSLFGPGAALCGASFALAPLLICVTAWSRGRRVSLLQGEERASWPLPAGGDEAELDLFELRLNRDVTQRGQPQQHAHVLFTEAAPPGFPVHCTSIHPIPLEQARATKVGDPEVEARIARTVSAWRLSFARSALQDVAKWGASHRAIFALSDGPAPDAPTAESGDPLGAFVARLDPPPPAEAVERRRRTWARLRAEGHRVPPAHLPFLPMSSIPRSPQEVAERASLLFALSMAAQEVLHTGALQALKEPLAASRGAMSSSERAFADAPGRAEAQVLAWRLEGVRVLAWALGWMPELPANTDPWVPSGGDTAILGQIRDRKAGEQLLGADVLTDALDYVYCARWLVVNAGLKGQVVPGLHPMVLLERHRVMGWLTEAGDWDVVDLST